MDRHRLDVALQSAADRVLQHHSVSSARFEKVSFSFTSHFPAIQRATIEADATLAQLTIDTDAALLINSRDGFSLLSSRTSIHSFMATDKLPTVNLNADAPEKPSPIIRKDSLRPRKNVAKNKSNKPDSTAIRHVSRVIDEVNNPLPTVTTLASKPPQLQRHSTVAPSSTSATTAQLTTATNTTSAVTNVSSSTVQTNRSLATDRPSDTDALLMVASHAPRSAFTPIRRPHAADDEDEHELADTVHGAHLAR